MINLRKLEWPIVGIGVIFSVALVGFAMLAGYRLWDVPQWAFGSLSVRQAVLEYRTASAPVFAALVQGAGAIFLVFGAWAVYRQLRTAEEVQRQQRLDRAEEMVSSDRPEQRLLGISTLERLTGSSREERQHVVDFLAAMVRSRSASRPAGSLELSPDLQAAIYAISRLHAASAGQLRIDLTAANLSYAVLQSVDLRGAQMARVDLTGAKLKGAHLSEAVLRNATLINASLNFATIHAVDLTSVQAQGIQVGYTSGDSIVAAGARFDRAEFQRVTLTHADLQDCRFDGSTLVNFLFYGSDLRRASFLDAVMHYSRFSQSDARGADLRIRPFPFLDGGPFYYSIHVSDGTNLDPRYPAGRTQTTEPSYGQYGPRDRKDIPKDPGLVEHVTAQNGSVAPPKGPWWKWKWRRPRATAPADGQDATPSGRP